VQGAVNELRTEHTREKLVHRSTVLIFLAVVLTVAAVSAAVGGGTSSNLKEALVAQIDLAEQHPTDASVLNDLGNLLSLAGDLERAAEAYHRAVDIEPESVTPRFNLALLLQQQGDLSATVRQLRKVVDLDPEHAWAHYQLGAIHEARREEKQAIRAYARAFGLDPELSFPEINPHIIENQLVMPALLQAFRGQEGPGAPNSYDDGARIASILVPVSPTFSSSWQAPATQPAEVAIDEEYAGSSTSAMSDSSGFEEPGFEEPVQEGLEDEQEQPRQVRVLTEDDLKPGRVNQASAPGRSPNRGRVGGSRQSARDAEAARLRTWSRSRKSANPQARPPAGGTPGIAPPPRGTRMQPENPGPRNRHPLSFSPRSAQYG